MGWGKIKSAVGKVASNPFVQKAAIVTNPLLGAQAIAGGIAASGGAGDLFNKMMGETGMQSASNLDPYQRALLGTTAVSLSGKMPSAIETMSKGMTSMDNAYDAAGSAGVLAAMKANNLAAANRTRALNAAKFQRTGLGRAAANTLADESLGRLNAEADKWDVTNKQGAIENAYTRQQQWGQLLNSMYGASLGNTMENAAIKNPGLPEVVSTLGGIAGIGKSIGLV